MLFITNCTKVLFTLAGKVSKLAIIQALYSSP